MFILELVGHQSYCYDIFCDIGDTNTWITENIGDIGSIKEIENLYTQLTEYDTGGA
jgi:hypothetical protein